jgi:hypothetical protein
MGLLLIIVIVLILVGLGGAFAVSPGFLLLCLVALVAFLALRGRL